MNRSLIGHIVEEPWKNGPIRVLTLIKKFAEFYIELIVNSKAQDYYTFERV